MKRCDNLILRIKSNPDELPAVRDAVRAWTAGAGWDAHAIADTVLAVDEALTNVIRHGYEGAADKPIDVSIKQITDPKFGEGFAVVILDEGKQVPLDRIQGRDLADLRPGGLGVHIIRSVMDVAEYSHRDGAGMRLELRKFKSTCDEKQARGNTP